MGNFLTHTPSGQKCRERENRKETNCYLLTQQKHQWMRHCIKCVGNINYSLAGTKRSTEGYALEAASIREAISATVAANLPQAGRVGNKLPKAAQTAGRKTVEDWAAAFNYNRGTSELSDAAGRGETSKFAPDQILEMTFLDLFCGRRAGRGDRYS